MSPAEPSSTCVLQALDVLSNTSRATLLHYKAQLQAVVQKLDDPKPAVSATPPRPLVEELIELLRGDLPTIKTLLSEVRVIDIKSGPEWTKEDPRIVDIQSSEKPKVSPEAKLRTLLSQRSLAEELQVWEINSSKGEAKPAKKLGKVKRFISANANRFFDGSAARRGIQHGQKLFRCERSLGVGFSAILIFYRDKIRKVTDQHLVNLKHAIDEQHKNSISNNEDSIKDIAEHQEDWLKERQIEYNAWCAKYIEDRTAAPTAGTKRLLPSLPLPQYKRNKPNKQQGDPPKTARSSRKGNLRKKTSLGANATDSLTGPNSTNISSAVAPLPAQHTQSDVHEQYQQPRSPPLSSQNNVSLSVCDGFNRDNIYNTNGRAKGNTLPQSFNSSMQETQGSVLHREEPIRQSSNAMPSSFPTDPHRHQGQEHINQNNMEANNLMGTDEQGQLHQMRLDGRQNATSDIAPLDVLSPAANDASHQNERYHPAVTDQPFQDTSSEQLHRFGIASNQLAINEGRTFDSSHASIRDLCQSFNLPSHTDNGILSSSTQSREDGFQPSQYYHPANSSFNIQLHNSSTTFDEGGFQPSQYDCGGNASSSNIQPQYLTTQSQEDGFQPSQYDCGGNASSSNIQPQYLTTQSQEDGFQPSQHYRGGNASSSDIQPQYLTTQPQEDDFQPSQYNCGGNASSSDIQTQYLTTQPQGFQPSQYYQGPNLFI